MTGFNPHSFGLPAAEIINRLSDSLSKRGTVIVTAPPGAGKSTLLPLAMLEMVAEDKKIVMLEPRRIAARQVAERMAEMIGEKVGETVGYRIRFENKVSPRTRIEVVTEGILTRRLTSDNELTDVGIVVFDEFHERSLNADVALALCRECQTVLRDDLKIVIMSATIDASQLSDMLDAPVIESKGRMFDVQTVMVEDNSLNSLMIDNCFQAGKICQVIREAHRKYVGDILVFLPGEGEIKRCEERLKDAFENTKVCPLYGMLNQKEQRGAILPDSNGLRKIVLATSIAETSLTIEGVRVVVDSGLCKQMIYDPMTSLSRLETVRISRDMAEQRKGRAGRVTEGVCYRVWDKVTDSQMKNTREPEINQADLTPVMLDLAIWGETNIVNLTWLTLPPRHAVKQARDLLEMLGALDEMGRLTSLGREIGKWPCHPRIAKMMMMAATDEEKAVAADIAAIIEERDFLGKDSGVDVNLRIEALRRFRRGDGGSRSWARTEQVAAQYRRMMKAQEDNGMLNVCLTGKLIAAAYPERIAVAHQGNLGIYRLANGQLAKMEHTDPMAAEDWIVVAQMDCRDNMGKIFMASPVDVNDLTKFARVVENVSWDSRKGCIVAQKEKRVGKIVIDAKPLQNVDRGAIDAAILQAVEKDGLSMLDWNDDVEQLQNRILSLRCWHENDMWPDVRTDALMKSAADWLEPYLGKATNVADLKKIDLTEAILYALDYDKQHDLDRLAPTHIQVASGSKIKLQYQCNGNAPVLAVRLQECFGMAATPTVDNGRVKVLMHLLSPGYKPVQITQDLKSFWDNAYFDVKKELKSRYPKHVWPDKPWEEQATRGVKKRV